MHSSYRVLTIPPPPHSTPSLEPDSVEHEYHSPSDDYLTTPDLLEWREVRILEYEKDKKFAEDAQKHLDLPALDLCKQEALLPELPDHPVWPYTTIAPEDVFPDYAEVRQYLQEQARSSSPSLEDELVETEIPLCVDVGSSSRPASPMPIASSMRGIGTKSKRDNCDDEEPTPKRVRHRRHGVSAKNIDSNIDSDHDRDQEDYDGVGYTSYRSAKHCPSHRRTKGNRRFAASKPAKSNRGGKYEEGPCSCRAQDCPHCTMTCFYTFVHGQRKGEVCRRFFEKNRYLDLKRHKATHAIQEWKLLEDGDIKTEDAYWHLVVFEGKEHGLICPNGDCPTTFTRYDALKRHLERGTCQYGIPANDLDNRKLKAQFMKASNEKRERITQSEPPA